MKKGLAIILVIAIITITATATPALYDTRNVEDFGAKDETEFQKRVPVIFNGCFTSNVTT